MFNVNGLTCSQTTGVICSPLGDMCFCKYIWGTLSEWQFHMKLNGYCDRHLAKKQFHASRDSCISYEMTLILRFCLSYNKKKKKKNEKNYFLTVFFTVSSIAFIIRQEKKTLS